MQRSSLLWLSRLVLPAFFLSYATYANLAALTGRDAERLRQVEGSLVRGEATANLGEAYAKAMPHREPAVAWLGAARYLLASEGRNGVVVGEDDWLFSDEEMVAASDAQIARMVEEALAAQARLEALGTRLVVVPLPAKIDIHRERAPVPEAALAMEEQLARFLAALAEAGIDAVEVRPVLRALAEGGQAFLARDTHWTPEGAAAVAAVVAGSGFVAPGSDDFMGRVGEPQEVMGDLVSFVTSERIAPHLGLGAETVRPIVVEPAGTASGGIFAADAPAITVFLTGTSYSADDLWSFGPALSLALGRDVLNLAEQGQGPVRPLRAMMDDLGQNEDAPEYVIWEVPVRYLADPHIWPDPLEPDADAAPERSM